MAIIYPAWFGRMIPEQWEVIGSWTIHEATVAGHLTITIYSLDPALTPHFKAVFRQHGFPSGVTVEYNESQPVTP